jgi:hypothetical protein
MCCCNLRRSRLHHRRQQNRGLRQRHRDAHKDHCRRLLPQLPLRRLLRSLRGPIPGRRGRRFRPLRGRSRHCDVPSGGVEGSGISPVRIPAAYRSTQVRGPGSLRVRLLDELHLLTPEVLQERYRPALSTVLIFLPYPSRAWAVSRGRPLMRGRLARPSETDASPPLP